MRKTPTRRRFLQATAVSATTFWSGRLSAGEKKILANERLHVGIIGVAGQGEYDTNEVVKAGAAIVARCDVDEKRAGKARERFAEAKFYTDFRRLLDQKGVDAVVIATPDHTHAVATMAALKAGLHVYCEKPLTHCVEEARVVAETAATQKRVTQMGTQIHADRDYRRVVELVQSGAIGPVREVHALRGAESGAGGVGAAGGGLAVVEPGLPFGRRRHRPTALAPWAGDPAGQLARLGQ
jgi:predicted dehydrogenase